MVLRSGAGDHRLGGGRNGPFPPESHREKVGPRPPPFPVDFWQGRGRFDPKIDDLWPQILKIRAITASQPVGVITVRAITPSQPVGLAHSFRPMQMQHCYESTYSIASQLMGGSPSRPTPPAMLAPAASESRRLCARAKGCSKIWRMPASASSRSSSF